MPVSRAESSMEIADCSAAQSRTVSTFDHDPYDSISNSCSNYSGSIADEEAVPWQGDKEANVTFGSIAVESSAQVRFGSATTTHYHGPVTQVYSTTKDEKESAAVPIPIDTTLLSAIEKTPFSSRQAPAAPSEPAGLHKEGDPQTVDTALQGRHCFVTGHFIHGMVGRTHGQRMA